MIKKHLHIYGVSNKHEVDIEVELEEEVDDIKRDLLCQLKSGVKHTDLKLTRHGKLENIGVMEGEKDCSNIIFDWDI